MKRKLTNTEKSIISTMIKACDKKWHDLLSQVEGSWVQPMADGGMGSLLFVSDTLQKRRLGKPLKDFQFTDTDDVLVFITINLDQDYNFELDIWKVDFSPLITLPAPSELTLVR